MITMSSSQVLSIAMKLICEDGVSAQALRRKIGLNQAAFWGKVGVTQSGGSRYESGREMPVQVAWAIHIAYGTEAQAKELIRCIRSPKQKM